MPRNGLKVENLIFGSCHITCIERRKRKSNPSPFIINLERRCILLVKRYFWTIIIKEGDMIWIHVKTNFEWGKSPITSQTRIIYKMYSQISLRGDDTFHTCICVSIFTNVINFAEWVIREYKIRHEYTFDIISDEENIFPLHY